MDQFEATGLWWLPGDEDTKYVGNLRCSRTGKLELSLVGDAETLGALTQREEHEAILGSIDQSPAGNKVTLTGCVRTGSNIGSFLGRREKYSATRGYFGAHLTQPEDYQFRKLELRIGGLAEWVHPQSGFQMHPFHGPAEQPGPLLSYTMRKPISGKTPEGFIALGVGLRMESQSLAYRYSEDPYLAVQTSAAKSADSLNEEYAYPLQNLMTLVSDRAQFIERFTVHPERHNGSATPFGEIRIIGPRVMPEDRGDQPRHQEFLFTIADLTRPLPEFIATWLGVARKYADACTIYFAPKYAPPAYIDMKFPVIVQALLLYDSRREAGTRRLAEEEERLRSILQRLSPADGRWVVDHVGIHPASPMKVVLASLLEEHAPYIDPLISSRRDAFMSRVESTLLYMARRDDETERAALHGADLYWAMEKLNFLMKACFLKEIGFGPDKILAMFQKNAMYLHVGNIEAQEEAARRAGRG
jgi:hypothetical protein